MTETEHLAARLAEAGLPPEAQEYLLDLWAVIHLLDDAVDGDAISGVSAVAWALFGRMPMNAFYKHSMPTLQPLLVMQLIKWEAANAAEKAGLASEQSYMWRAGYYEIVAMSLHLCGLDPKMGLKMYGETFADYRREFPCQDH